MSDPDEARGPSAEHGSGLGDEVGPASGDEGPGDASSDPLPRGWSPQHREREQQLLAVLSTAAPGSAEHTQARSDLVHLHMPLVQFLARRFRDRGEPLEDLTQVGMVGLLKAVDRFDVDRGVELATYATPTVVGEIKRHFRDKGWAVRVPRRLQELRSTMSAATAELAQRNGRTPTVPELAAYLEVSEEEILEGLEGAQAYSYTSLDAPRGDAEDSGSWGDMLGEDEPLFEAIEYREALRPLLAQLPARERRILVLRFVHGMTQTQISDEVGISQMHVSRLLARTLATLRDGLAQE